MRGILAAAVSAAVVVEDDLSSYRIKKIGAKSVKMKLWNFSSYQNSKQADERKSIKA